MAHPETETPEVDAVIIMPALLRDARGSYAQAVRAQLAAAGFDDLPRNGPFVLGGMARFNASAADMITGLGVTKQAASQLIDVLVVRGYLTREIDPDDRRRMTISLTERGRSAAQTTQICRRVDRRRTGRDDHAGAAVRTRAGLTALGQIKVHAGHAHPHPHED